MVSNRHFRPKNALSFNYYSAHTTTRREKVERKNWEGSRELTSTKRKHFPTELQRWSRSSITKTKISYAKLSWFLCTWKMNNSTPNPHSDNLKSRLNHLNSLGVFDKNCKMEWNQLDSYVMWIPNMGTPKQKNLANFGIKLVSSCSRHQSHIWTVNTKEVEQVLITGKRATFEVGIENVIIHKGH